jgi:hypothetical protein
MAGLDCSEAKAVPCYIYSGQRGFGIYAVLFREPTTKASPARPTPMVG